MKSKFFGEIDINNVQDCYDASLDLDGAAINVDVWFEQKTIDPELIEEVDSFYNALPSHVRLVKEIIASDFEFGEEVKEYLDNELYALEDPELAALGIDLTKDEPAKMHDLYQKLHLKRVGTYPSEPAGGAFAVFDFTISEEITDQLLVVKLDKQGQLVELTSES